MYGRKKCRKGAVAYKPGSDLSKVRLRSRQRVGAYYNRMDKRMWYLNLAWSKVEAYKEGLCLLYTLVNSEQNNVRFAIAWDLISL